jgi:phosphoglycolate phosphatase-like HAD superfamily hydrolase
MQTYKLRRGATDDLGLDFAMNQPDEPDDMIIVGDNIFDAGSSREAVVNALDNCGIRCANDSRSVTSRKTGANIAVAHIRFRQHAIAMEKP